MSKSLVDFKQEIYYNLNFEEYTLVKAGILHVGELVGTYHLSRLL